MLLKITKKALQSLLETCIYSVQHIEDKNKHQSINQFWPKKN